MSLRLRLIVAFFFLSVVPLAAVTLFTYASNARAMREAAGREAELLAGELSQRMQVVTAQLSERVERLMDVAEARAEATAAESARTAALATTGTVEPAAAAPPYPGNAGRSGARRDGDAARERRVARPARAASARRTWWSGRWPWTVRRGRRQSRCALRHAAPAGRANRADATGRERPAGAGDDGGRACDAARKRHRRPAAVSVVRVQPRATDLRRAARRATRAPRRPTAPRPTRPREAILHRREPFRLGAVALASLRRHSFHRRFPIGRPPPGAEGSSIPTPRLAIAS